MHIAEPSYLLLLWLIPALAVFYMWSFRRREQLLQLFARSEMLARLLPPVSQRRQRLKAALLTTAVVFALFALLRPQWGFHWEEITREGVDIMVAVDVSQSMMAQDVKPNRLKRAQQELEDLLNKLQGDRVGLIAFAGTAFVQCPLTLDYGAFRMFLDYLSPDLIPVPGTALGEAIRVAKESFVEQSSTSKALILITDGEGHEGDPVEIAKEAKEAGIKIFTIGIGAPEGAPIPSPTGDGFIKDESGQVVMTRLDEETLQRIAVETGGAYVHATTGDLDLERIYTEGIKQSLENAELKSTRQKRWEERFQWPLFVTVLLVILEALITERGRRRVAGAAAALLLLGGLTSGTAQAGVLGDGTIREGLKAYEKQDFETALQKLTDAQIEHPNDPLLDYNLGNAYYKTRRFAEAETSYQKVVARTPDPALREKAYYNLGNTAYRQGKLDEAVKNYQEALKIDPNDLDSKKNLERTRAEIRRRMEENKKQQQQRQEKQQQEQQDKQKQADSGGGKDQQKQQGQQDKQTPQNQQGEQDKQAQQQQAQQNKPGDKDKQDKDQQAGQQQAQEQKEKAAQAEKDKQGQGDKKDPSQAAQQAAQAQEEKQGQGEKKDKDGEQQEGRIVGQGKLTKEEAQRLLNQVRDEQRAAMRRQGQPRRGQAAQPPGGKPW